MASKIKELEAAKAKIRHQETELANRMNETFYFKADGKPPLDQDYDAYFDMATGKFVVVHKTTLPYDNDTELTTELTMGMETAVKFANWILDLTKES